MPAKRKSPFCYEYPRPAVTADAIVWSVGDHGWRVLLIERKSEPFAGRWAIPGGFVNEDEPPRDAAVRELREETGVRGEDFRDVGVFGEKGRDPRGWTISSAFYTLIPEGQVRARAGDDASRTRWHPMDDLPALAFDHAQILEAATRRLAVDLYATSVGRSLLPKSFNPGEFGRLARLLDDDAPTGAGAIARLRAFGLVRLTPGGQWRFV